jgi:uncharacterized membrane protein YhiD involved in acid resistance
MWHEIFRLSSAVGVACGVGLFRIATTAAITTIVILQSGRVKPKNHRRLAKEETTVAASTTTEKDNKQHLIRIGKDPEMEAVVEKAWRRNTTMEISTAQQEHVVQTSLEKNNQQQQQQQTVWRNPNLSDKFP